MLELKVTVTSLDHAEEAAELLRRVANGLDAESGDQGTDAGETSNGGAPRRRRRTKAEMEASRAASPAAADAGKPEETKPAATKPDVDDLMGPEPDAGEQPKALTKEEAEAMFKGEVRPALGAIITKLGQDEARKFLNDYGFEKLTDLPTEKYADFVAACKAKVG